ncbi:unnamed protein product [Echinostoma caproni]|uniref:Caprin-1_dimer domain-containing protein n=1 Tax=Echinostoma caproni TaxID=27848 RepID=A0A183APA4_9TREM|nr:unnamed protein product [Echinostoma caproni]
MQEFITQSKELLDAIEQSVKYEESQLAVAHERHTLSFLHTHACLMRLLNALDIAPVRMAITRASSENHLKLLDVLRNLTTAPVLDNWPGTSTAALSDVTSFLQQQPSLSAAAEHINNFVLGRSVPIPLPSDFDGSHKKFTYKDARILCFRLLATSSVQRSMGLPSRPASVVSSVHEEHPYEAHERDIEQPVKVSATADQALEHAPSTPTRGDFSSAPESNTPEFTDTTTTNLGILDQVIKPLGGTFNFLQASKVVAPDPIMLIQSPVREEVPPISATNGVSDRQRLDSHPTNQSMEPSPVAVERCYTPVTQNKSPTNYTIPVEPHVEMLSTQTGRDLPVEEIPEQIHHEDEEELQLSAPVSSKPVSYADLVRRQGYHRPPIHPQPTGIEIRKQESYTGSHTDTDASAEITQNGYHAMLPGTRGSFGRGGSARGRGQGEFRGGGRGGQNRGGFTGAPRRVGGPRGGRYDSGSGRGGPAYRGMPAGITQSTY